MIKGIVYSVIIILVVSLAGVIILDKSLPVNDFVKKNLFSLKSSDKDVDLSPNTATSDEKEVGTAPLGGGTAGGGGGGGGGDESGTDEGELSCPMKQIAYSLKNFVDKGECLESGINGCTKMEKTCSVEIHNLDDEFSGDFSITISLINTATGVREEFVSLSKNIRPNLYEMMLKVFTIQDINGITEGRRCDFETVSIPKKPECN